MKVKTPLLLLAFWISSFAFQIQPSKAQDTPAGVSQNEPVLSGSGLKSEDAILKTDVVFVGQITHLGFGNKKALGEAIYRGIQIKPLQILRGSLQPESTYILRVYHVYSSDEYPPKEGSSYIFFVKRNDPSEKDIYTILKLLPATDDNIAKVKKLIAAAPAASAAPAAPATK